MRLSPVLAPSGHNTQPWLFNVSGDAVELHADRTRGLPVVDPEDRALVISCGAALFFLRTAIRHFGELVTDPTVRLADVEAHLATLSGGDELFGGRYRVASISGSTGRRGSSSGALASGPPCVPTTTAPSTGLVLGPALPTARGWRW
jgi:hypothetical protein